MALPPDAVQAVTPAGRGLRRRVLWTLLLLGAAGLLIRGAYLLIAGPDRPLVGDEPGYHGIAAAFLAGEGWHDGPFRATRPPLTSWLLTLVYLATGPSAAAGRWSMVVVSALVAPIVFLVGRAFFGEGSRAPLWAAIAWLVYPPSVFYAASLVTENLAALLSVAGVGGYLWAARTRSRWAAALTGVMWAGAALNRPSMLASPLFLLGIHAVLGHNRQWRWSGVQWAAALAAFGMGLAPWTVRNYRVLDAFIPVTSYGGIMFSSSNATLGHPTVQAGGYYHAPGIRGYLQSLPESAWGPEGLRMGIEQIGEHPALFLEAVFHRAVNFWTPRPDPYDPSWTRNDWVMSFIWIPTLLFSFLSFVRAPGHLDWPSLVLVGYTFLVTLPFWGTPRFRFPIDSLVLLRALVSVEAGVGAARARWKRPRGAAVAP